MRRLRQQSRQQLRQQTGPIIFMVLLFIALAGCSGAKMLDDPQPLVLERPLTTNSDQRLEVHLDWVIIRDGPGTWVESANWDEYLLRVRNRSGATIRITDVAVYDSLDTRLEASANLNKVTSASRETARRYKSQGLNVRAGAGGEVLMAAGTVGFFGSYALGTSILAGSASASAAGLAVGAFVIAPVLIVGGAIQAKNKDRVAREMTGRNSPLPVDLAPGEPQSMTVFFPVAPSPRQIELVYEDSMGAHKIIIDTRKILQGLHIAGQE